MAIIMMTIDGGGDVDISGNDDYNNGDDDNDIL